MDVKDRSASLTEQADTALDAVLDNYGGTFSSAERRIARMMWLDGYKAGMDAVQGLAVTAMQKISDGLS